MCFFNYVTVTFSIGLPAKIVVYLVPASQVRFLQFHVIERFCFKGSNKRIDRGALFSHDLEFFIDRT